MNNKKTDTVQIFTLPSPLQNGKKWPRLLRILKGTNVIVKDFKV